MSIIVETPFQNFTGLDGKPLTNGKVYIGQVGTDPTVFANQIPVFWDEALTIPASQPLSTNAGYIVRLGTPARVWTGTDYSMSVKNASNILVYYNQKQGVIDYSGPDGSSMVGYLLAAGLYPQSVQDRLRDEIDLMSFIPESERLDITNKTSTYDASDDIIRAILFVSLLPLGTVLTAPRGKFMCSKQIPWKNNVVLKGKTKMATVFEFTHTGHGFVSTNTLNSSTAANIGIYNCTITANYLVSTGAAFVDVAGSYVDLDMVKVTGFRFGSIFDQSEHVNVDRCEYISPPSGIGIWIVNGPDFTPGSLPNFTNKIAITRTQFNASSTARFNILDDGGVSHAIRDCNFNAGICGIRAAGVYGLEIRSNEMEVHTSEDIYLADTTYAGTYIGPCVGFEISANVPISGSGGRNIAIQNASNGVINSNCFGQAAACINFLNGSSNPSTGIVIEGNTKLVSGVGRSTTGPFVSGSATVIRQNSIRQVAVTYSPIGAAAGTATITPKTMEAIGIGTRMRLVNADGANSEYAVVSAVTATTFTIILATAKAVDFQIYGATPLDQEQGAWPVAPALGASGVDGSHAGTFYGTFSRRGNEVTINGSITVTTKDAAMSGALLIRNLPYPAVNVPNAPFLMNLSLFSGFTFAGGAYSTLSGFISPGASVIDLRKSGSGLGVTTVPATDIPGTTVTIIFSGSYLTSAL